jgi:hypothetical protein
MLCFHCCVLFLVIYQRKVHKQYCFLLCFSLNWNIKSHVFCRYDDTGFKINNVKYEGSLLIVENMIMTWTPKMFSEITAER